MARKWKMVRCVVEYRTDDPAYTEQRLVSDVQFVLDNHGHMLAKSKPWAKAFTKVIARLQFHRPKKLQSTIRAFDSAMKKLRNL